MFFRLRLKHEKWMCIQSLPNFRAPLRSEIGHSLTSAFPPPIFIYFLLQCLRKRGGEKQKHCCDERKWKCHGDVSSLILHTHSTYVIFPQKCRPPQYPRGLCVMCVCEGEREWRTQKEADDGCVLPLTVWWIATGLCEDLMQEVSGVRKVVLSSAETQSKQRCTHVPWIQMHHC